jgi:hypothetical protein
MWREEARPGHAHGKASDRSAQKADQMRGDLDSDSAEAADELLQVPGLVLLLVFLLLRVLRSALLFE